MAQDTGAVAAAEDALGCSDAITASVLMPYVDERLTTIALRRVDTAVTTLAGQTGAARAATVRAAIEDLLSVRRDFADAPSAARVPRGRCRPCGPPPSARSRKRSSARCSRRWTTRSRCPRRRQARSWPPPAATGRRAQLGCGLDEFRAGRLPQAADHLAGPARRLPEQRGRGTGSVGAHRGERRAGDDRPDPGARAARHAGRPHGDLLQRHLHATAPADHRGDRGGRHGAGCPFLPGVLAKLDTCPSPGGKPTARPCGWRAGSTTCCCGPRAAAA